MRTSDRAVLAADRPPRGQGGRIFGRAQADDRLVARKTRDLLWAPKPHSPRYGYGFQIKRGWVGHTGGFDGYESYVYYFPETKRLFVLLCNYYDSGYPLAKKISHLQSRFGER